MTRPIITKEPRGTYCDRFVMGDIVKGRERGEVRERTGEMGKGEEKES